MKKDDILKAAIDEFGKYNYNRASINTIIENSKTSKGTFYHYFKSKEALYLEIIKMVSQEKIKFLKNCDDIVAAPNQNQNETLFEMLKSNVAITMKFTVAYPEYATFSSQVANETNKEIKNKVNDIVGQATKEYLSALIKQNIKERKIRNDIPEQFVCDILMYMIGQFNDFVLNIGVELKPDNTPLITEYLSYYIDFLENGLKYNND